ncbi:phosphoserine phosphatase SerB [Lautropia mirabilis]|uniref:phosphoserine phosphatase SerB n=1 Tax=Lautropia mirabilis TaxID=47671 RepID=UPI0028EE2CB1|nr:phosphoserine phosphatase SerB [Lautropia mirabilis]
MNHAGKQIIVQKQPALDTETINAISAELQQASVEHPAPSLARWRAEPQSPAVFDDWAERFGVDAANVPNGLRLADFRLLAIDMDSTLVTMETLDEIADMAGLKAEVAAITEAAMRGEIKDFSESLTRRMALLKGVGEDLIERVYQERLHLSPGAEILLAAAKAAGLKTMLVSGGFTHFTERLKQRLGFDYAFANQFDIANQRLTGRVLGPIVDGAFKARAVQQCCQDIGCPPSQAIAIGDGANDLGMMAVAGLSVGYHAKPVVREKATWSVRKGGLGVVVGWFGG